MPKTVLITGCSSGIGHALALEFLSKGFTVFATARKTTSIADLASKGIIALPLEATDESSIQSLHNEIDTRTGGRLDILVNNAGRNYTVPGTDITMDEVRDTFDTNVFAVMRLCQVFTPLLIAAGGEGTIIQIGSVAGVIPYAFGSVYNASKAALHAYSNTLRVELAPLGVRVVVVVTGGVLSNIGRTKRELPADSLFWPLREVYQKRLTHSQANGIPAEDYARQVVGKVVGTRRNTVWAGGRVGVVWFVTTFLPRWVMDMAMTRIFQLWKLAGSGRKKVE